MPVVEDDAAVRRVTLYALRETGYCTLEAEDASEAMNLLGRHLDIALLFTDIDMRDTDSGRLAEAAVHRRPDIKVLFSTIFSRRVVLVSE